MPLGPFTRVLVVDDFPAMRRLLRNALRELGVSEIHEATNGKEAMEILEAEGIDLVLSDWNMPGMSGLDLLVWVRTSQEFRHLPFIMVTAEGDKMNVVEAIKHEVSNYIIKPFTAEILEAKIRQVLG